MGYVERGDGHHMPFCELPRTPSLAHDSWDKEASFTSVGEGAVLSENQMICISRRYPGG